MTTWKSMNGLWSAAFAILGLCSSVAAQGGPSDSSSRVRVSHFPASATAAPGADLPISIELDIEEGWHVWTNDRSLPSTLARFEGAVWTEVSASTAPSPIRYALAATSEWLAPGATDEPRAAVFAQWPEFHQVKADVGDGLLEYAVFEGRSTIFVPISIAANAPHGAYTFTLEVSFQACDATSCLAPATAMIVVPITVAASAPAVAAAPELHGFDPAIFGLIHGGKGPVAAVQFDVFGFDFSIDPSGTGFVLLLLIAAAGGLLLNFTPCVLPVIPLKIMGLAHVAGNRKRCAQLGGALSIGVIAFWLGLGAAVALLSGFTSSQLFQYPLFTVGIGLVICVMAIGMCGFFSLQVPQSIAGIDFRHDTMTGSVGFGVMTAILSTPCTAPLMGAAAAWAATQSPATVLAVFAAIGTGMALPYFVLSSFPQLVSRVPRSGPASDLVKQTMGLLLLAAGAYFVGSGTAGWLTQPPEPPPHTYWWAVSALGAAAGLWLAVRAIKIEGLTKGRSPFIAIGLFIVTVSTLIGIRMTDEGKIDWVYYTPERLTESLANSNGVMIDFTAEWCLNCKTLETTVLESDGVVEAIEKSGVTPIKVDLTGNNAPGRELLKKFDRLTIPLLIVLDHDGKELLKSDAYTRGQVEEALRRAHDSVKTRP